ncbi:hypothetical protein ACFQU7_43950 [Pseudoroseomonas wenyumeiae]
MLGRGIFGSREVALPNEVAVYITEDDSGTLVVWCCRPGPRPIPQRRATCQAAPVRCSAAPSLRSMMESGNLRR